MRDHEQQENERILKLMGDLQGRDDPNRHRAIHEAGHAIAALDLGLPLVSVSIKKEEREDADGPTYGSVKVRPIADCFAKKEIEEHSPYVIEDVKKRIVMLLAAEAATKKVLKQQKDFRSPLALTVRRYRHHRGDDGRERDETTHR